MVILKFWFTTKLLLGRRDRMVVGYITAYAISAYHHKRSNPAQARCTRYNIIHLFTGYEGNSTFIVPKVPTIVRGNAEYSSWYRGDNKSYYPNIKSKSVLLYWTNVQFKIPNCRPFSDGFLVYFISTNTFSCVCIWRRN